MPEFRYAFLHCISCVLAVPLLFLSLFWLIGALGIAQRSGHDLSRGGGFFLDAKISRKVATF